MDHRLTAQWLAAAALSAAQHRRDIGLVNWLILMSRTHMECAK